jgi:GTPase SAR1 family protein
MGNACKKEQKAPEVKAVEQMNEYKVIVVGESGVGKTAFIYSFINEKNANGLIQVPTAGVSNQYKIVNVPGGGKNGLPKQVKLDIWDTPGG